MGLLDQFGSLNPEQTQGLLAAASQMLQQSGPSRTPTSFGQIVGGGLTAYQGAMTEAKKRKQEEEQQRQMAEMRALQMRAAQGSLQDSDLARTKQAAIQAAARGSMQTSGVMAGAMSGGPTPGNAVQIPNMGGGFDNEYFIRQVMQIDPMQGLALAQQLKKQGTEYGTDVKVGVGPDGKPFSYLIGKDGSQKRLDGTLPRDETKVMDLNNRKVAYNSFALKPGEEFKVGQSPDSLASNGIARERLNFDRSQVGKPSFNAEVGGFISPPSVANPNGGITPLAGLPPRGPKMTEDQGKATGWLVQAENAFGNMKKAMTSTPSAAKPGLNDAIAGIPSFGIGEALANTMRGTDRQKFMQGASSLSESLLRAATGAGVNRDEAAQKIRELTPVFGEDDATTAQKMEAIPLYIESLKVRAGPGATQAAQVLGGRPKAQSGQWSIQRVGD